VAYAVVLWLCPLLLFGASASARTVTDELGRQMNLPEHPRRIICLAPSLADMVFALGHGSDIAGVTDYSHYPQAARTRPSVGSIIAPSAERIVSLHPDLVLVLTSLAETGKLQFLHQLDVPVFAIDPHGLEGVYRSILNVGNALNDAPRARQLVDSLRRREQALRGRNSQRPRPSVLVVVWTDPLITAGRGAFLTEAISVAGGNSITAGVTGEWPNVSLEFVLHQQPQYLLFFRDNAASPSALRGQSGGSALPAVRQQKNLWADERMEYSSPALFDAMEDLSRQIEAISR
jgi:iron complex transport system substrate-binding protein